MDTNINYGISPDFNPNLNYYQPPPDFNLTPSIPEVPAAPEVTVVKNNDKRTSYIIIGITAALALIAIITVIVLAVAKVGPFAPYKPVNPPNTFRPGGAVINLTPQQISQRKAALSNPGP